MRVKLAENSLYSTLPGATPLAANKVRLSLRSKGMLAFVVLLAYVAVVGLFAALERSKLFAAVQELERIHVIEERLARVNTAVANAVLNLQEAYYTSVPRTEHEGVTIDVEAVQGGLEQLKQHEPKFRHRIATLARDLSSFQRLPARSALLALRIGLHDLVSELDEFTRRVRDRKDRLSNEYRVAYDAMTLITLIGGLVGAMLFGGIVTLFFSRLVWDIKKLEARALEIVAGYRGVPLEVMRRDELGSLMESVNRIQSELAHHEHQLEISRRQSFHQEKMAALGALAASVAHEINNPIAAISGVAEAIHEVRCSPACASAGVPCHPELILEQTSRITKITRQLAEMSAPMSPEMQLLDLNGLVRNVCSFVGYDKRFRNVNLTLDPDPHLPAVNGVPDHLTQVLMNLLINAADAVEGVTARKPSIAVETRTSGDEALLSVIDSGCGMDDETRARAFDEGFTTKPAGKGSGLGLFMCKSLLADMGARIDLDSTPGSGTRVTVHMPLPQQG